VGDYISKRKIATGCINFLKSDEPELEVPKDELLDDGAGLVEKFFDFSETWGRTRLAVPQA
jgi:hypothetical protein